jgi:gliding motility-associated-like protein
MKKESGLQKATPLFVEQSPSQATNKGLRASVKSLVVLVLLCFFSGESKSQLIVQYDFAGLTYSATLLGYEKSGVGIYYRQATGGTISFGTTSCFGYSISAPTSSSQFYFKAEKDINSFTVRGTGTGSNRTFTALATSATLGTGYSAVPAVGSGIINSTTCGGIMVTPTTVIPAGTFFRATFSGNLNITSIEFNFVPTGTPPAITTNSVTCGQNQTTVNGTVIPGTMPLHSSGIVWSTSSTPLDLSLTTKTVITPAATGAFSNNATSLSPGTTYYYRAYVKDVAGNVYYGATLNCQTLAATIPAITTKPAFNILSYKASSGGMNIDSGGLSITQKGICWSTTPSPTIASNKTSEGPFASDFNSLMRGLSPCVTYYVRSYAVNAIGVGYGNEVQFQTTCPGAPSLVANPVALNFGNIPYNGSSTIFSYTLTGYDLTPGAGNITVLPPAGYTLSLTAGSGFTSPLVIPYTGGALPVKTIYVKLATSSYGTYNGGIIHSGGGVAPPSADTVNLTGAIIPDPNVTTNSGTDFWTGFGYQERMDQPAGDADETKMSLYISVPSGSTAALVSVELPGIPGATGFPKQNLVVNPGTVLEVTGFPTGDPGDEMNPSGLPDSRLYYTGLSKRGIHITSTNGVPVSVWMHTYAQNNSAAGAMLFPTNTWNNAYTVQAFGGQTTSVQPVGGFTNNSNPNSFFFVIANEDNTPVWFTPSQDIIDSSASTLFTEGHATTMVKYAKNIEHGPIMLNKGQVFNAMGFVQGTGSSANGLDLSGSKVRTNCDKKIAVFGGNGRCLVNATNCTASSGSDHMIQQMFPSVAWGTRYLTAPTKTMEYNIYRINVSDPATQVWVNNPAHTTPLTGLINNQYYQVQSNSPLLIESSKAVNVTQFIVAGQCNTSQGGKGDGDPEMIILSPVQQAINSATVYSATIKKSGGSSAAQGHYINVIIHKDGRATFKLDGLSTADTGRSQVGANATTCYDAGGTISMMNAFQQHPRDPDYYYAKFKVAQGQAHRLSSDSNFVAIAYGMGSGESYGYNGGTNIKDLTKPLYIDNPYLPNNTNNTSCTNNPINLKAVLPYPPAQVDSITWNMGSISGVSPQANATQYNPVPDGTVVIDGVTYYIYKNPTTYTFGAGGSYNITGFVGGTFASQCGSQSPFNFNINIVDPGFADFNINYNPCVDDTVRFSDASSGNGFPITGWQWNFGDVGTSTIQNPTHVYATHSTYTISLRAINSIGCYADKSKSIDMNAQLIAGFTVRDTICQASSVSFTDTSSNAGLGGAIADWFWDYGDGTKDTVHTSSTMTHSYTSPGEYYVKLKVQTAAGCTATFTDTITVRANPVTNFDPPAGVCLPGSTLFNNTTIIPDGTISNVTYLWNFGDNSTSTTASPSHTYPNAAPPPGGYNVVLTATSQYGCVGTKSISLSAVYTKPVAQFTAPAVACLNDSIQVTDGSSGVNQTITQWQWNFGDGNTSTLKDPRQAYSTAGNYSVTLTVTSDKGCVSDVSTASNVKVNPLPVAAFTMPSGCLSSGSVTFTDNSSITPNDGTQHPFTYQWTIGTTPYSVQNPQHTFTAPGNYNIRQIVITANGCRDTADAVFAIAGTRPNPGFNTGTAAHCANSPVSIQNATTIDIGTVTRIEIIWDNVNAPGTIETFNNPVAGQVFTHAYPDFHTLPAKTYAIKMIAYSGTACSQEITKTITVNPSPTTLFSSVAGICLGDSRVITQGSQSSTLPGTFSYSGNGINATGMFVSATAGAGTHQLQYTYTTTAGCSNTSNSSILIWPAPNADFNVSNPRCEKSNVTLSDASNAGVGAITSWTWTYGDGPGADIRSNNLPFTHQYSASNTYTITLQVNTSNGCSSPVASKAITINPLPKVGFIPPTGICLPDGRGTFTDTSSITDGSQGSFSYRWDFGDGGFSLQKDPQHRFTTTGLFNVKLKVTSNNGCTDSLTKIFADVYPQPKAGMLTTPADGQVCLGDSIRFANASDGMGGVVNKWGWTLGDATTDTTSTFWHTYTAANTYTVSLHVFNDRGCVSDTVTRQVIVEGYPDLEAGPDVYMLQGGSVTLNPTVTGSGAAVQYLWFGPNLSNNTVRNPVASPVDDQQYILRVTNGPGCSAQDTLTVRLYRPPVFPNAFSPNADGIHDTWSITHLSTYSQAKLEVFNRHGQVVYSSTGYSKPWDGTSNGKPLPVGTYYYVIHLGVLPQPISGWVMLLR